MHRRNGISFALVWAAIGFAVLVGPANARPFVAGFERFHAVQPSIEGGRLLFNELGCVNCHQTDTGLPARKGPRLDGIRHRIRQDWLEDFINDPQAMRPGTVMPDMGLSESEATAVAHYLRSIDSKGKRPKAFKFVNKERGKILYETIGCITCHGPNPLESHSNNRSYASLPDFKAKSDIHALAAYIQNPHAIHPEGRMPKFQFEREDIGDLAAYLLDYSNGDSTVYPSIETRTPDPILVNKGKALFESKRCIACHESGQAYDSAELSDFPIQGSELPLNEHPEYGLSSSQSRSLELFIHSFLQETITPAPAMTTLQALNCLACHERDGIGGHSQESNPYAVGDPDLGDAGRLPPPLTAIGAKLQEEWLDEAIAGRKTVRPYLKTRMPDFGKAVHGLSSRLASEDRVPTELPIDPALAPHGRDLLGSEGGLNCITCHSWRDRPSLGIKGMDLSSMHERLRPDWLRDFLINPAAHRPNTLMPSFWPGGDASNQEILDGDTDAQIAAIYAYSKYGDGYPSGMPESQANGYELVPQERPIIQRTFFEGVGTNAILVGFPEGLHVAIDGSTGRPAVSWKGRFFDAYRTWFSRFPQFESPLGESIISWNSDTVAGQQQRFRGYRIDDDGVPEFISEIEGSPCHESLFPSLDENDKPVLQRRISFSREIQIERYGITHPQGAVVRELPSPSPLERRYQYKW